MRVPGRKGEYRSVGFKDGKLLLIDQTTLPLKFRIRCYKSYKGACRAIQSMVVRGAPAIGVTGGFALALAAREFRTLDFNKFIRRMEKVKEELLSTRPTAVDLFNVLNRIMRVMSSAKNTGRAIQLIEEEATRICEEVVASCREIGMRGERLIDKGARILTHCNAGALATVDYGTALSPIRFANRAGKDPFVFVDETRPRFQGSLTSWELLGEGIEHRIIVDNAAGYYMTNGEVDLCIVGADRICVKDGSFANKIGTYEKAVLARENRIPFYVAAPTSTFDLHLKGDEIPIEERDVSEVLLSRFFPKKAKALNPAFDVTPAKYVTAYITEKGVFGPSELRSFQKL